MIQFPVIDIDLLLKTDVTLRFSDISSNMMLKFSGDAAFSYMVSKPFSHLLLHVVPSTYSKRHLIVEIGWPAYYSELSLRNVL